MDKTAKISIRLTPRSSKDRFVSKQGDQIKINLTAPPVDGEANQSLIRFLAKSLGVKASNLTIVQGMSSRTKTVQVSGYDQEQLDDMLESALKKIDLKPPK
jgi:uncharacterized protein (TIGR00251 family)